VVAPKRPDARARAPPPARPHAPAPDTVANATAQLAYTNLPGRLTKRWNFPAFYYSLNATFSDAAGAPVTVEYVFIDTVILCGLSVPGGKGQPEGPRDADPAADQLAWIKMALATSAADWLIVAGHYPVYSVAEHGSTACLVEQLKPLLAANKVAAYVNGHDHNLQHIEVEGVTYVTLGPGHDVDVDQSHASTVPAGGLKFYDAPANGGFASFTFYNKTTLGVELYEAAATPRVAHAFSVANPRAA